MIGATAVLAIAVVPMSADRGDDDTSTQWAPRLVSESEEALAAVNRIREQAGQPPVVNEPRFQRYVDAHTCWALRNGTMMHGAIPGTPDFTPDAHIGGARSVLTFNVSDASAAVDLWATAPYHAIALIRPELRSVAYSRCEADGARFRSVAAMDVISGRQAISPGARPLVLFPADGAVTHLDRFYTEHPNPLDNCGWDSAGLPVIAMLPERPGRSVAARMSGPHGEVETCVITEHNEVDPRARTILANSQAVIVVPRRPLVNGRWTVNLDDGGQVVEWGFDVAVEGSPRSPKADRLIELDASTGATSRLSMTEPCRSYDSRRSDGALPPGTTTTVALDELCDMPSEVVAALVTITVIDAARTGFVSALPRGAAATTSTMNLEAGDVRSNMAIVPVGRSGEIDVHLDAGGHLAVDVIGAFVEADRSREGRFRPLSPARLTDTRHGPPLASGESIVIDAPDQVPDDAIGLVVNITTVDALGRGFVSASVPGIRRPDVSVLNLDAANQTRAATTVVPIRDGRFEVFSSSGGHVLVDAVGWFTGPSASESDVGLFVSTDPARALDARSGVVQRSAGSTVRFTVPPGTAAVAKNVTIADPVSTGFVTAYPDRANPMRTSTVNVDGEVAVANFAVTPTPDGRFSVFNQAGGDLIVDVAGWFTG